MAPRKAARPYKRRRTRQRKFRKGRKTVRGHRHSTTGTLYPPLDVRSPKDIEEILKRITKGPVTVLLVYADWCGHCHTLMPHFKKASNHPQRNAQVISVPDTMLPQFKRKMKSVNSSEDFTVLGYPSVALVSTDGTKLSDIPTTPEALNSVMVNAGPVAVEAGLAEPNSIVSTTKRRAPSPRTESAEEIVKNVAENEIMDQGRNSVNRMSVNNALTMEEIGMEPAGLATGPTTKAPFERLNDKNISRSENIGVAPPFSTNRIVPKRVAKRFDTKRISGVNVPKSAITNTITAKDVEEITSLRAPLSNQDSEINSSLVVPDETSDALPIRIGGVRGGSLYGIMTQSAYRLAPAAVLLATAAAVMKNSRGKTHRRKTRGKTRGKTRR